MNKSIRGFTIVELLIVIVVIAILAAISVVAYNGIQDRARQSKIDSDLALIMKAIQAARVNNDSTMIGLPIGGSVEGGCWSKASGTDLAALPTSDTCWSAYITAMATIAAKSGINVANMKDPWGRPYYINANEAENQTTHLCMNDYIGVYRYPHVMGSVQINKPVPLWSTTC